MPLPTNPATIDDVTKRAFRSLTPTEVISATTLLDDAWYMLLGSTVGSQVIFRLTVSAELPIIDPVFEKNVIRVLSTAVVRVVHNPTGDLETEGDDFRRRKDAAVSSGRLYITAEELGELFPSEGTGNAFTIRPMGNPTMRAPLPDDAFYEPMEYI